MRKSDRKEKQITENDSVIAFYDLCFEEMMTERFNYKQDKKRLRSCTAWVYETTNYYVLQSYGTVIACIDKENDTLYDFLRYVYGFTNTSAQHIRKFSKDYGAGKWGCTNTMTYREV